MEEEKAREVFSHRKIPNIHAILVLYVFYGIKPILKKTMFFVNIKLTSIMFTRIFSNDMIRLTKRSFPFRR